MGNEYYYMYCPVCGDIYRCYKDEVSQSLFCVGSGDKQCHTCNVELVLSKSPADYYRNKATELYNDVGEWAKILFDEEICKNPKYSKEVDEELRNKMYESACSAVKQSFASSNTYTPKCPICQSPNIKKLSEVNRAVHGLAFGLFSKTARSQWVCNSCGNKW